MSKRFHDTEIWGEDWFIAMPRDYRDFWLYIKDDCNHAGIWRPKVAGFNKMYDCTVSLKEALKYFNKDRIEEERRVEVLRNGRWFLCGFIPFQYGLRLNLGSPMHRSVYELLSANEVSLTSIRPQVEVIGRVKDKDKDRDKDKDKIKEKVQGNKMPPPDEKQIFGSYVYLTAKELHSLMLDFGSSRVKEYLARLDEYIGTNVPKHSKKYTSHYHVILSWLRKDNIKKIPPVKPIVITPPEERVDPAEIHKFTKELSQKVGEK